MKSFNIKFPLKDNFETNTFFQMNQITKDVFTSNLLLLLLTEVGERYYDPNYGTNLIKFLFDPGDSITADDIEEEIKQKVTLYIPNLTISGMSFNIDNNQINVHINFVYQEDAFSENGTLDLNF